MAKVRITVVPAADLHDRLCADLRDLTMARGIMRNYLTFAREGHDTNVVTARQDGQLVGWAIALRHQLSPPGVYELGVYVDRPFRRRGIGARLLATLVQQDPTGRYACSTHDQASAALYRPYGFLKRTG
jgi:GNAT superfamily N-acetyltransferase